MTQCRWKYLIHKVFVLNIKSLQLYVCKRQYAHSYARIFIDFDKFLCLLLGPKSDCTLYITVISSHPECRNARNVERGARRSELGAQGTRRRCALWWWHWKLRIQGSRQPDTAGSDDRMVTNDGQCVTSSWVLSHNIISDEGQHDMDLC